MCHHYRFRRSPTLGDFDRRWNPNLIGNKAHGLPIKVKLCVNSFLSSDDIIMIERALLQILIIQEDKKTDSYTFLSESECSASYQSNYFFILKLSLALLTTQYFSINLLSNNEFALLEKQVLSWLSGQAVIRSH